MVKGKMLACGDAACSLGLVGSSLGLGTRLRLVLTLIIAVHYLRMAIELSYLFSRYFLRILLHQKVAQKEDILIWYNFAKLRVWAMSISAEIKL